MYNQYLVTGGTGFLGRSILQKLSHSGAKVRTFVLPDDPYAAMIPPDVQSVTGDLLDDASLDRFFEGAGAGTCVIHCAGIISIASHPAPILQRVNVDGTKRVLDRCRTHGVDKLIYVSSVHALPEKPKGQTITEDCRLSPDLVEGGYAKTKAVAANLVFDAASQGLNACVVYPSGIIGPGDLQSGSFTTMAKDYLCGKLPLAVRGGYDFVDVRDVATGILACSERGIPGEGYILSGHYTTIKGMLEMVGRAAGLRHRSIYLPLAIAKLAAPFYEKKTLREKKPLFFTPYSISVLGSNGQFSCRKASNQFSYQARPLEETLQDMTEWLLHNNSVQTSSR